MEFNIEVFFAILLTVLQKYFPEEVDMVFKPKDVPQEELLHEYDFIIVGGGSAGCVLANRLTENSKWTVLLIEAGGDETPESGVPLLSPFFRGTDLDWNYTTVPQAHVCQGLNGVCGYPRGHVMGGCSTINGMNYVRGNKKDYNEWANLGNDGWSYNDVLPYFIKAEHTNEQNLISSSYRGVSGPLNVQYSKYHTSLREDLLQAGKELGLKYMDYNGVRQENTIDYTQLTVNDASRHSTSKAYLNPVRNRKNLSVIKRSYVEKILINESNNSAIGVKYSRNGNVYEILAKNEVIISAGAINTPKLLMLSGIGPKEELEKHGIKPISNLPVGKNLQDHVGVKMYFEIDKNVTLTSNIWMSNNSIIDYAENKSGPLTTNGVDVTAFINPNDKMAPPTISYLITGTNLNYQQKDNKQIVLLNIILLHAKSTGSVRLQSKNPTTKPLIDPNLLSEEYDKKILRKGVETAFKLMNTINLKKYSPKLYTDAQPLCNNGLKQKEFITCIIKWYSEPFYHSVGTAKMGPNSDETTVVSPKLLVKGFQNLRVIDSSIMPVIPRGFTYAPTIMISEKAADIIKNKGKKFLKKKKFNTESFQNSGKQISSLKNL